MASPQKEDGHMRLATELVLVFCMYRLSGQEWQVLWVILRKTWGWNKKADCISLSQMAELTSIKRANLIRIIKKLVNKGVIKKDNSLYLNSYSFNKNYEQWKGLSTIAMEVLSKRITKEKKSVLILDQSVIQKDTKGVIQTVTHNKQYNNHYTIENLDFKKRWPDAPTDFKDLVKKLSKKK